MKNRIGSKLIGSKVFRTITVSLLLAALLFFGFGPEIAYLNFNLVSSDWSFEAKPETTALHETLRVVDLHNDALLWERDLLTRNEGGHSDVPRLIQGGVVVEVFSTVTQASPSQGETNTGDESLTGLLFFAQLRPPRTWFSPYARAIDQAARLQNFEAEGDGILKIIRTKGDLASLPQGTLGGLLATEGMQAAEGNMEKVQALYDAGFRMFGLAHFFDNAFAGSSHGVERHGLTGLGRELVVFAERNGVIIDVAHASEATINDVTGMATQPVVASHTGARGVCDSQRNLSDDSIRRIADTGGLIGIGFWAGATCETSVDSIVASIRYVADLVGVEYVALGSDFDGTVTVPFDGSEMERLTEGLIDAGFSEQEIRLIMGENAFRVLTETLPEN